MSLNPILSSVLPSSCRGGGHPLRATRRTGFTLVELMVASAVFVIIMLAVGGLLLNTNDLSEEDEEYRIASLDMATLMETINGLPFDDIVTTYPDGLTVPDYAGLNLDSETLTVSYTDPAATNPLQVNLQITWIGHRGRTKSKTMSGLRVR